MNKEQAKQIIKSKLPEYLTAHGYPIDGTKFRCPNPAHPDHNPSANYYEGRIHCLSCNGGAGGWYDTLDMIGWEYGLTGYNDKLFKACEIYGITLDGVYGPETAQYGVSGYTGTGTPDNSKNAAQAAKQPAQRKILKYTANTYLDLTDNIMKAHELLVNGKQPDVIRARERLHSRGIDDDAIRRFKIGYVYGHNMPLLPDKTDYAIGKGIAKHYDICFPFMDAAGVCRYYMTEIKDRQIIDREKIHGINLAKYMKPKKGQGRHPLQAECFNERYLKANTPDVVFICEGIYDALSIELAGGYAIALTGKSDSRLLSVLNHYKPNTVLILVPDNDAPGREAMEKLSNALTDLDALHLVKQLNITDDAGDMLKDANDVWCYEPELLRNWIIDAYGEAAELKQDILNDYMQGINTESLMDAFTASIENTDYNKPVSTGFKSLDDVLEGGLYNGQLYIMGAVSSLGKTTFALQIADNIAAAGRDVMYFTLEMDKTDLIARSVSRYTYQITGRNKHRSFATVDLLSGSRYQERTPEQNNIIHQALDHYRQTVAPTMYMFESSKDTTPGKKSSRIGVDDLVNAVKRHIKITGRKPVVFIDYLQIQEPDSDRSSDKQNTDKAVTLIKSVLCRDYKIPVFAISSFNRQSYTEPVNTSAFKESGAIEYTADVLIGLQYNGMEYIDSDGNSSAMRMMRVTQIISDMEDAGKKGDSQFIDVKVMKNRNGAKGTVSMMLVPKYNMFIDSIDDYKNTRQHDTNRGRKAIEM